MNPVGRFRQRPVCQQRPPRFPARWCRLPRFQSSAALNESGALGIPLDVPHHAIEMLVGLDRGTRKGDRRSILGNVRCMACLANALVRATATAERRLQAKLLGRPFRPTGIAVGTPAMKASADGLHLGFGLR